MNDENPGLLKTLLGLLGKGGSWLFDKLSTRLRIREIKRGHDSDIDGTLDLFERLFKEQHRIASADLVAWLNKQSYRGKAGLQHCLLVVKQQGVIVALLKVIYCPISKFALISYFGVDKTDPASRRICLKLMFQLLKKYLRRRWKQCLGIVYEADIPQTNLSKRENDERKARLRLFRHLARRMGFQTYGVGIDYVQPHMADAATYTTPGTRMALMLIPRIRPATETLSKSECEALLRFLHLGVYATTQQMTRSREEAYLTYLRTHHSKVTKDLPDAVPLEG